MLNRCNLNFILSFFKEQDLNPKRGLSQNFLISAHSVDRIVASLNLVDQDAVLEIGPGIGALTERLHSHPIHLTCIEKDHSLIPLLRHFSNSQTLSYRLEVGDCLDFSLAKLAHSKKWKIVSNMPYHITSKILKKLALENMHIDCAVLMCESGYLTDLIEAQNKKNHDATSFIIHAVFSIQHLFSISKNNFYPKPKIDSSIFLLKPRELPVDLFSFFLFIEKIFSQKRKMLSSILKNQFQIDSHFSSQLDLKRRPETLSREEALLLFEELHHYKNF